MSLSLFCVMLSRSNSDGMRVPAPKQVFYLRGATPEAAISMAVKDNPGWHVIGIEPEGMVLQPKPAAAASAPDVWDAA
jgi:hypothetical protein